MLDQVLDLFRIRIDRDLALMKPNQSLAGLTARAVESIDAYLAEEKPSLVLVQGDTTTVFCAALAAYYNRIPVGHVEAGLRTGNILMPWPEEGNRILTTHLAALHFAPTALAAENLRREGVPADRIHVTGNTVIDALFLVLEVSRSCPVDIPGLPPKSAGGGDSDRIILVTGHRRENFGEGFERICRAIGKLAARFPDVRIVYPVHLNPNVREPVLRILSGISNVHLIEPLDYLRFVSLMDRAALVLTDSGGVQEEAPSLGKPVLVMRDATERPEAVAAGTARLVGTSVDRIVEEAGRLLTDPAARASMSRAHNPYGDGKATGRILDACERYLAGGSGAAADAG
jgi:UDP-N-acetylglucosamine 2-epimerase (non-hydrolysing)